MLLPRPVKFAFPVNFKMYPGLKSATIAQLVITKARMASRIVLGAFPGSTKIKTARVLAKIVLKTRHQPIPYARLHATFVVWAGQHQKEAWFVLNVWPGNLKKRRTRTKRYVLNVHPATTRIHPI